MAALTISMIDPTTGQPGTTTLNWDDASANVVAPLVLQCWGFDPAAGQTPGQFFLSYLLNHVILRDAKRQAAINDEQATNSHQSAVQGAEAIQPTFN